MRFSQPLGSLAFAVMEQHADLVRRAVGTAVERHLVLPHGVGRAARVVSGRVFTETELGEYPLQAGNWLAVGAIEDGAATTLVEVNLRTWESREIVVTAPAADAIAC